MKGPVKTVLVGLTDPGQALEAGLLGIDGIVVAVGGDAPFAVGADTAEEIARTMPPLAARVALVEPGAPLPLGFTGAVTSPGDPRPAGALFRIVRLDGTRPMPERLPPDVTAAWMMPAVEGSSTATRFDFGGIATLGRRLRTIVEVPDGAAGVETAVRLGRPYAVLFADAVWFRPGIIDLDLLERAIGVVARLNKAAYG